MKSKLGALIELTASLLTRDCQPVRAIALATESHDGPCATAKP